MEFIIIVQVSCFGSIWLKMFNSRAVFKSYRNFGNIILCMWIRSLLTLLSARIYSPPGIKTAETQKSWFIFFQSWLNSVPAPAGGYFKPSQNGTVDSEGGEGGGAWSCHSQCLRPLSLRCQALEGCHEYPESVCHPPWRTHTHIQEEKLIQLLTATFKNENHHIKM